MPNHKLGTPCIHSTWWPCEPNLHIAVISPVTITHSQMHESTQQASPQLHQPNLPANRQTKIPDSTAVPHFTRLFRMASAESPSNGPNPRCEILISAFKNWRPRPEAGACHHEPKQPLYVARCTLGAERRQGLFLTPRFGGLGGVGSLLLVVWFE